MRISDWSSDVCSSDLNVHASLLPRWRGAAPIQRAILAGDEQTGVTIMQMEKGLDTGAMLDVSTTPVDRKTAGQLTDELAQTGARQMVGVLGRPPLIRPVPPPAGDRTHTRLTSRHSCAPSIQRSARNTKQGSHK